MDKIRVGIIGTGGIVRNRHLPDLHKHSSRVTIAAIAEPSQDAVDLFLDNEFADDEALGVYKDHQAMLDAGGLDAVIISSPHTLHFQQIMDCLDAGLHILCEKPMVCSAEEAEQVAARARETGREIVVAYQRRFDANYRYLRRFVRSEEFGAVQFTSAFQSQGWLISQKGKWRQDPKLSGGGQLNDSGSHLLDFLLWTLPEDIVEVTACIDNRGTEVDVDSVIQFRTAGGGLGAISILGSAPIQGMVEDITFSGDKQSIYIRPGQVQASMACGESLQDVDDFGDIEGTSPVAHFLDVLQGKAANESPPEDFVKVIRFTEGCWQSAAQDGAAITLRNTLT